MCNDGQQMTPEQIRNYRKILFLQIGPYANIMPDEDVVRHRDAVQDQINRIAKGGD